MLDRQGIEHHLETRPNFLNLCVAYSADGLTWRESPNNPVGGRIEMAGGTRVDGCYYLAGQGGKHAVGVRQLVTCASYDFEHWADATCSGLRRSNVAPQRLVAGKNTGEQVHLGAALWNRGNVIMGFFGKWNGHPSNDRRMVTMDLGFAVNVVEGVTGPIRVRVDFGGVRPEDVRLYAVYLDPA